MKLLSKISTTSYDGWYSDMEDADLSCRIKYVVLEEYNTGSNLHFVDSIFDSTFFEKPDIKITYNSEMIDEFSFSLAPTPVDKYDFVTLALRDIAKGLGFSSNLTADVNNRRLNIIEGRPLTPYENHIMQSIGTNNPTQAYLNATNGFLDISIQDYGTLSLYAPNNWQNGISLNALIPDSTKKISELLSYDFGRGSIIRDICDNYKPLFKYLHGWRAENLTVGFNSKSTSVSGTTNNMIAYKGKIEEDINSGKTYVLNEYTDPFSQKAVTTADNGMSFDISEFCFPYDYRFPFNGIGNWVVSILKKDGTWDPVYDLPVPYQYEPLEITMGDLDINSNADIYQRTCDGHLRCRITYYKEVYDNLYHKIKYNIRTKYYVLDYLPQQVKMKVLNRHNDLALKKSATNDIYTREIEIGMKGLEGIERIIVEQLDEGNDMPMKYEVKDFKKGYFMATVDKELYTQFTVYAYNKNGCTKSETITVPPLYERIKNINVGVGNGSLAISKSSDSGVDEQCHYVFSIYPCNSLGKAVAVKKGEVLSLPSNIDICDLSKGYYTINIADNLGYKQSFKFLKH